MNAAQDLAQSEALTDDDQTELHAAIERDEAEMVERWGMFAQLRKAGDAAQLHAWLNATFTDRSDFSSKMGLRDPSPPERVTVLRNKYVAGADRGPGMHARSRGFLSSLRVSHLDDAHMQLAQSSDFPGARLLMADVGHVDIRMPRIGFDLDGPGHAATDAWRAATEPKLTAAVNALAGVWYATQNGYRLILDIAPFAIRTHHDAGAWARCYAAASKDIGARFGIDVDLDASCSDFTRLLRLPNVRRDGKVLQSAVRSSPPDAIVYQLPADPGPSKDDLRKLRYRDGRAAPISQAPVSSDAGEDPAESKLGRLAERLGYLGKRLRSGKRVAVCPNSEEHSTDSPDGSDCVLFSATGALGGFHCSHDSCKALTAREVLEGWEAEEAAVTAELHATDEGLGQRFLWLYGSVVRWCPPLACWFVWDDARWAQDDTMRVQALVKDVARLCWREMATFEEGSEQRKRASKAALYAESRQGAVNLLEAAKPGCVVLPKELDADPYALNVANGTLDLRTGQLHPHRREDLLTKITPGAYQADARSQLWDGLLADVTGGDNDLARYLQRVAGYTLLGVCDAKAFFFCYGPPDGGKSTFLNALGDALGEYRCATNASTWLRHTNTGGNRGDIVRLRGVRMATCSEFKVGSVFDEELMKAITGGDLISHAAKYKDDVEFYPSSTPFLAGNDRPRIGGDDDGMWRRARCIPFTHSVPRSKQDAKLPEKLRDPAVQAAILAWAVAGLAAYRTSGLGSCAAVEQATAEYRSENDAFGLFIKECCDVSPDYECDSTTLYSAYKAWTRDQKRYLLDRVKVADKLEKLGATPKRTSQSRKWVGIAVKAECIGWGS